MQTNDQTAKVNSFTDPSAFTSLRLLKTQTASIFLIRKSSSRQKAAEPKRDESTTKKMRLSENEGIQDNNVFVVTGGLGFVGAALCAVLISRGALEVRAFDLRSSSQFSYRLVANGVRIFQGKMASVYIHVQFVLLHPGEERHLPRTVSFVKLGIMPFKIGEENLKSDWIYVDNLVLALIMASMGLLDDILGKGETPVAAGQAYFICDAKEELGYTPMVSPKDGMSATISYWQKKKRTELDGPKLLTWVIVVFGMVAFFAAGYLPNVGPVRPRDR